MRRMGSTEQLSVIVYIPLIQDTAVLFERPPFSLPYQFGFTADEDVFYLHASLFLGADQFDQRICLGIRVDPVSIKR